MESKLAHDLSKDIWRSDDVSIGAYRKNESQIEIITPNQVASLRKKTTTHSGNGVTPPSIPNVNSTFSSIKINPQIVENLKSCGFTRPSPIQATSIPLGRIGIDLIAQSKSGTGKTLVFVICALEMMIQVQQEAPVPRVLIVAPTREIAIQIGDIIDSLTSNWKSVACYKAIGGTKVSENISRLSTSQIVVGTPGRICCLLEMDFLKPNSIRLLVLDECDKLMEESFKKQIDKLFGYLPTNKQMIVTSATMSDEMALFLSNYMRSPALVRLNAHNPALLGVMQLYHRIEGHLLDYLNFEAKIEPLLSILSEISFSQCVIFCNFQTRAKYLYDRLVSAKWTVTHISGDMTQKERTEAINAFRKHKCRILVSTDLTSRGIDIHTVNLIVNLDVPIDSETYLHRIGRAGRFGSAGIAITLVGTDYAKFMNIVTEYSLDVQPLTLPIKSNLWNSFYHDRLDRNRAQLLRNWKEGLQANELFDTVVRHYKRLTAPYADQRELQTYHTTALSGLNSFTHSNSNSVHERQFLSNLLCSPQFSNWESNEQSDEMPVDIEPQRAAEIETELEETVNLKPICLPEEEKSQSEVQPPPSNVNAEERRLRQLFSRSFLRPSRMNSPSGYSALICPDVAVCKYLLTGGINAPR